MIQILEEHPNYSKYSSGTNKEKEYLAYIIEHKNNIIKAFENSLVNDEFKENYDELYKKVINHDYSKLDEEEFEAYRNYFYPNEEELKNDDDFNKAWEHHYKNNSHHPEYHSKNEIPKIDILEMILDWEAMGYKFGNSAKDFYNTKKKEELLDKEFNIDLSYLESSFFNLETEKGGDSLKKISINVKFSFDNNYENGFSRGKCYICYYNGNLNGSFISKEDIEKALPTLINKPIVGEYVEDLKDFSDHEGYEMRPYPCGVIPMDSKFYWEILDDGNEYLVVEGLILWTRRYPELKNVLTTMNPQSMEISLIDNSDENYFSEKDGFYHIGAFEFEALCILNHDVQPCFEGSHFETYSMKETFRKEYELMLKEFKNFSMQGGKSMDEKLELLSKYSHLEEEVITELKINIDNYSLEELESKLKEKEKQEFTLSINQIRQAIEDVLSERKIIMKDYWGDPYESEEFCMVDIVVEDKLVIVCKCCKWNEYYAIPYEMSGDEVILDFENKVDYVVGDWRAKIEANVDENMNDTMDFSVIKTSFDKNIEYSINKAIEKIKAEFKIEETEEYKTLFTQLEESNNKFEKLQGEFTALETEKSTLQANFEALTTDKETIQTELDSFKLKEKEGQVNELFSKEEFTCLNETESYKELKTKAIDMDLSEAKKELFALLGEFASKTFSKKKEDSPLINFGLYKYEPKSKEDTKDEEPDYVKQWCK